jgi:hypothetical protein
MPHHLNNAKMFSNVLSITIDPYYTTKMCIVKISHKTCLILLSRSGTYITVNKNFKISRVRKNVATVLQWHSKLRGNYIFIT